MFFLADRNNFCHGKTVTPKLLFLKLTALNYDYFLTIKGKSFTFQIFVNLHASYPKFKYFTWIFHWKKRKNSIMLLNWSLLICSTKTYAVNEYPIIYWSFLLGSLTNHPHIELSVLRINYNNGVKGLKTNGCLFSKCMWDVQEKNGKPWTICDHILQLPWWLQ